MPAPVRYADAMRSTYVVAFRTQHRTYIGCDKYVYSDNVGIVADRSLYKIKNALIAFSGYLCDAQDLIVSLKSKIHSDDSLTDAPVIYRVLQSLVYERRNRLNPMLKLDVVVGGYKFLGWIGPLGGMFEDNVICSGTAESLVLSTIRTMLEKESNLSGLDIMRKAHKELFLRNRLFSSVFDVGEIDECGSRIFTERIYDDPSGMTDEGVVRVSYAS